MHNIYVWRKRQNPLVGICPLRSLSWSKLPSAHQKKQATDVNLSSGRKSLLSLENLDNIRSQLIVIYFLKSIIELVKSYLDWLMWTLSNTLGKHYSLIVQDIDFEIYQV